MKFDPQKHHRRSIRLKGYNYAQTGAYFVTIVTQGRESLFGDVRNNEMVLNDAGNMVAKWWCTLPRKFPSIAVNTFVIMPNHFHGIIIIEENVGADLRVCPNGTENDGGREKGEHAGSPLPDNGTPRPNAPISQIIQWFKTMTTNEYIRGVKQLGWTTFLGKLWQRNYYEHIIRDDADWDRIQRYIEANPAMWADDQENPGNTR